MAEKTTRQKDPQTGKPLPKGVWYRGPNQYQARKMANGKRHRETFSTDTLAPRWLTETTAKVELGQFKDNGVEQKDHDTVVNRDISR